MTLNRRSSGHPNSVTIPERRVPVIATLAFIPAGLRRAPAL